MHVSARWYAVLGVLLSAVGVTGLVVTEPTGLRVLEYLLFTASGLLFLGAGISNPVRERFAWYELVGAGNVALGIALPAGALAGDLSTTQNLVAALAAVGGGLALTVIGLDYLRGGEWFDLPESLD